MLGVVGELTGGGGGGELVVQKFVLTPPVHSVLVVILGILLKQISGMCDQCLSVALSCLMQLETLLSQ